MTYPKVITFQEKIKDISVKTECIASLDGFSELKESWNKLWVNSRESHPFISWEWLYTWWEVFSNEKDVLMIITVYRGDALIGIAPFYLKQCYFDKALMFLGEGEAKKETVASHYLDLICEDINSEVVIDSVIAFLEKNKGWSHSKFSFVLDQSYLLSVFTRLKLPLSVHVPFGYQYRVDLKGSFNDLYNNLGKSTRRLFRLKRNRMQKQAPLTLVHLDVDDEMESSFDTLESLHAHRQELKGETNVFLQDKFKQFHVLLIKRLKGTGNVHLRALKHGDEIVACALNYVSSHASNRGIYSYASGFKSSDDKRFSPMFVFDILDFEHSIDNEYTYYDLLSDSEESSYKHKYKAGKKAVSRITWFTLSPVAIVRYIFVKTRYTVSIIKSRLKKS